MTLAEQTQGPSHYTSKKTINSGTLQYHRAWYTTDSDILRPKNGPQHTFIGQAQWGSMEIALRVQRAGARLTSSETDYQNIPASLLAPIE